MTFMPKLSKARVIDFGFQTDILPLHVS